jgi:hypothetical protein
MDCMKNRYGQKRNVGCAWRRFPDRAKMASLILNPDSLTQTGTKTGGWSIAKSVDYDRGTSFGQFTRAVSESAGTAHLMDDEISTRVIPA